MSVRQEVFALGLSHHTAPIEIREKVAVTESVLGEVLATLSAMEGLDEVLVVSTCNRVEIYGATEEPDAVLPRLRAYLSTRDATVDAHLYEHRGQDAIIHLFRVCGSLDSMVVGEPQILGQMKDAFAKAQEAGTVGSLLSRCFRRAFGVSKRVRTETQVGQAAVSVGYAAVELARKVLGEVEGRSVLLVGAGKMGRLTSRHLVGAGCTELLVTNRSTERAQALAEEIGGSAHPWSELPSLLKEADVVVCSTAAPEAVITRELAVAARRARKHRPLFLIDLAVPRDVDPAVNDLEGIFLFDIDDLDQVVDKNLEARRDEAQRAEILVAKDAQAFYGALRSEAGPLLRELHLRAERLANGEVLRTLSRHGASFTKEQEESVRALARALVNKILHEPSVRIREAGEADDGALLDAAKELFALGKESGSRQAEAGAAKRAVPAHANGDARVVPRHPEREGDEDAQGGAESAREQAWEEEAKVASRGRA